MAGQRNRTSCYKGESCCNSSSAFWPVPGPFFYPRRSPKFGRIRRGELRRPPPSSIEHPGLFCSVLDPDALQSALMRRC
jgi:hypothetical protein